MKAAFRPLQIDRNHAAADQALEVRGHPAHRIVISAQANPDFSFYNLHETEDIQPEPGEMCPNRRRPARCACAGEPGRSQAAGLAVGKKNEKCLLQKARRRLLRE